MITQVVLTGFFLELVCGNVADVVLSCNLVEEGAGLSRMTQGSSFARTPATLVLRDVVVPSDESLDLLTPFVAPSVPDPEAVIIEAKVSSPEIPHIDTLLHADCNDLEVMCEMSLYSMRSEAAHFMVSVSVEATKVSVMMIVQALDVAEQSGLVHSSLGLPLSPSGTIPSEVVFLVFSQRTFTSAQLKGDVVLHCGFRMREAEPEQDVALEWRLQHKGKGWRVLQAEARMGDTEESAVVREERLGSSVDVSQIVAGGDASVTLSTLRVSDEGSYICSVTVGPFHAQQIIQLHLNQPPRVSLSEEKLVGSEDPQTLSCHSSTYYPLDVQMEWSFLFPSDAEPNVPRDQGSLSSHRQHGDGSYSLSSHLMVPPAPPGTKITCRVSHRALDAPISVSLLVESPQTNSYWWILGFMIVTVLFFYQVMN